MDARGQTSIEYLLLVAGVVLLVLVIGYYLYQGAFTIHRDLNSVNTDIFE